MTSAKIDLDGKSLDLPVIEGSEGEKAVDITHLRKETGYITYDPGYVNTGSCSSDITFIDGEKGILRYRGIPIEDLAQGSSFLEICHLLIYGELPSKSDADQFANNVTHHTMIHEDFKRFFDGYPMNAHPMGVLASTVAALSTFYPQGENNDLDLNILRLLAKMNTLAAFAYKKSTGQPFMYPRNDLTFEENFLYMMFAVPAETYQPNPVIVESLRLLLILHADHEQNCSTSTVRMVGSSGANLFIAIAAGIAALSGRLHGGANQKVIEMLELIHNDNDDYKKYVEMAKDKELEEVALKDDFFLERKLYPNVDFYSGIIYRALGIPTSMFTVMFAIGRLPGWIAQWKELREDPKWRIYRPRQIYTGRTPADLEDGG